jgi:hypothetical protein
MKVCSRCLRNLPDECYHKASSRKSGLQPKCKECRKECLNIDAEKERKSKWYQEHKEYANSKSKEWAEENEEKRKEISRNYYHNNKEEIKKRLTSIERREKRNAYQRKRCKEDMSFRISCSLRRSIHKYLRKVKNRLHFKELIGCSVDFLVHHIEAQFVDGMSWDNYGSKWHIDHIKPCTKFDLSIKEEQLKCYHYSNLQPMWAIDNIKKSNKWGGE